MSMIVRPNEYYSSRNVQYRNANKRTSGETTFPLSKQQESKNVVADTEKPRVARNSFDPLGPNAPDSVRDAWDKAEQETGVNGYGKGGDGKLTHISAMLTMQIEQRLTRGHSDLLGQSKQSAIEATQRALDRMSSSLWISANPNSAELHKSEKSFYEAFLKNLDALE